MKTILPLTFLLLITLSSQAQQALADLNPQQKRLYQEHIFGGQPDGDSVLVRQAYVVNYNSQWRIPNWCAYHITKDYLNTPERESRFSRFREDTSVRKPVKDEDYDGLFATLNYARGHYAPYKILGGDRDQDGSYAQLEGPSDPEDELVVFEGNYMTNIVPQLHYGFNGSGGLWFKAERWVQDEVVNDSVEVWEFSGGLIIDDRSMEWVGPNRDIAVPDLFYKVVIKEGNQDYPDVLVFLFPHYDDKSDVSEKDIFQFLVTVDYLEAISGLDFFNEYPKTVQEEFEAKLDLKPWL